MFNDKPKKIFLESTMLGQAKQKHPDFPNAMLSMTSLLDSIDIVSWST
jgi:hypothetical protein